MQVRAILQLFPVTFPDGEIVNQLILMLSNSKLINLPIHQWRKKKGSDSKNKKIILVSVSLESFAIKCQVGQMI